MKEFRELKGPIPTLRHREIKGYTGPNLRAEGPLPLLSCVPCRHGILQEVGDGGHIPT